MVVGGKSIKEDSGMVPKVNIQSMIFTIRGVQVMVNRDLASVYGVETKVLDQDQ